MKISRRFDVENEEFISSANIDIDLLWQNILEEVAKNVSTLTFDVWIKTLEFENLKENTIVLSTPTVSSKNVLYKSHYDKLLNACKKVYSAITNLEIVVAESQPETSFESEDAEPSQVQSEEPKKRVYVDASKPKTISVNQEEVFHFNPKYTFDNFIVGGSNQFACAAAKSVADEPDCKINPLFIYGGSGLGKTHLLHAIGNQIHENRPELNVVYVTTNKFVRDFIASLQTKSTAEFREVYSKADVLIIDDIQEIVKKIQTQEQFFNLFNDLYQQGKQIVITSDKPPKDLEPLEERLRTRFEWGMLADIGEPDIETRIAILNKKAQIERYNVSKEVIEYIAEVATSNVRTMEGFLSRVVFYSGLQKEDVVTITSAREALKNIAPSNEETIDATKIVELTCKFYNVKKEDLLGKRRTKALAEARQIAMYLCTEYLNIPLESIGNVYGRDYSTVIYARNKVADDMKKSKKLEVEINDLKHMIEGK